MSEEVNVPLLRKVVEWAETEDAKPVSLCQWEQQSFVTSYDEQEHARQMVEETVWAKDDSYYARLASKVPECGTCYCIAGYVNEMHGNEPSDWRAAANLLGIPFDNGRLPMLFASGNTIEDVRRIAEDIAGEKL